MLDATPIRRLATDHGLSQASTYRTDKGYQGAGIGIWHPVKGHHPNPDTTTRNRLITQLRAPAERANAILNHFKALHKVTLDPWRITAITRSALVIATHTRGSW